MAVQFIDYIIIIFIFETIALNYLICQHGSLCPSMATVWKGSRPSSMKAFETANTLKEDDEDSAEMTMYIYEDHKNPQGGGYNPWYVW